MELGQKLIYTKHTVAGFLSLQYEVDGSSAEGSQEVGSSGVSDMA